MPKRKKLTCNITSNNLSKLLNILLSAVSCPRAMKALYIIMLKSAVIGGNQD